MKQRIASPLQTDIRKATSRQMPRNLNVHTEAPPVIQAPPPPEPAVARKNLEGKVIRSKKTKLEELNAQTMNSQGEVVSFIQAYFPK